MPSTPEKQILIAGGVLIGVGVANAVLNKQKVSIVLEGGIVLVLLTSLGAAIFPVAAKPLAALLLLAVVSALFVELPHVLSALGVKAQ